MDLNFYNQVEPIKLYDPLGDFLGAFENGIVEISYFDCVKLAGHSCPTVATTFLATRRALKEIYKDELPIRSHIEIKLKGDKKEGVNGVIANVAAFICGAGDEGGFSGIGGFFSRRDLIKYNQDIKGLISFRNIKKGIEVSIDIDTSVVGADPKMKEYMQKALITQDKEAKESFAKIWQERVKRFLLDKEIAQEAIKIVDKKGE